MRIRSARQEDLELLWSFLAIAAYEPDAAAAKAIPVIQHYLVGWKRPGDFGFVAEQHGKAVGAAWARQFSAEGNPFYLDDRTPELSIAVREDARGQGVGTALMRALIVEAASGGLGLCLNVRQENPAVALYERLGFRRAAGWEVRNRVGGLSIGMIMREPPD
jgi:ribosomal protein S18 acetylase RimI-like enzyme